MFYSHNRFSRPHSSFLCGICSPPSHLVPCLSFCLSSSLISPSSAASLHLFYCFLLHNSFFTGWFSIFRWCLPVSSSPSWFLPHFSLFPNPPPPQCRNFFLLFSPYLPPSIVLLSVILAKSTFIGEEYPHGNAADGDFWLAWLPPPPLPNHNPSLKLNQAAIGSVVLERGRERNKTEVLQQEPGCNANSCFLTPAINLPCSFWEQEEPQETG